MDDVDVDWGLEDDGYNDDCLSIGGDEDADDLDVGVGAGGNAVSVPVPPVKQVVSVDEAEAVNAEDVGEGEGERKSAADPEPSPATTTVPADENGEQPPPQQRSPRRENGTQDRLPAQRDGDRRGIDRPNGRGYGPARGGYGAQGNGPSQRGMDRRPDRERERILEPPAPAPAPGTGSDTRPRERYGRYDRPGWGERDRRGAPGRMGDGAMRPPPPARSNSARDGAGAQGPIGGDVRGYRRDGEYSDGSSGRGAPSPHPNDGGRREARDRVVGVDERVPPREPRAHRDTRDRDARDPAQRSASANPDTAPAPAPAPAEAQAQPSPGPSAPPNAPTGPRARPPMQGIDDRREMQDRPERRDERAERQDRGGRYDRPLDERDRHARLERQSDEKRGDAREPRPTMDTPTGPRVHPDRAPERSLAERMPPHPRDVRDPRDMRNVGRPQRGGHRFGGPPFRGGFDRRDEGRGGGPGGGPRGPPAGPPGPPGGRMGPGFDDSSDGAGGVGGAPPGPPGPPPSRGMRAWGPRERNDDRDVRPPGSHARPQEAYDRRGGGGPIGGPGSGRGENGDAQWERRGPLRGPPDGRDARDAPRDAPRAPRGGRNDGETAPRDIEPFGPGRPRDEPRQHRPERPPPERRDSRRSANGDVDDRGRGPVRRDDDMRRDDRRGDDRRGARDERRDMPPASAPPGMAPERPHADMPVGVHPDRARLVGDTRRPPVDSRSPERRGRGSGNASPDRAGAPRPGPAPLDESRPLPVPLRQPRGPPPDARGFGRPPPPGAAPAYGPNARGGGAPAPPSGGPGAPAYGPRAGRPRSRSPPRLHRGGGFERGAQPPPGPGRYPHAHARDDRRERPPKRGLDEPLGPPADREKRFRAPPAPRDDQRRR